MKVSGNIANLQARLEDKCQNSCHKSIGSNLIAYHSCTLFCSFVERHHLLDFQSWTRLLLEAIHQIGMGFVGGQNRPKWRPLIRGCCNLILLQTDPCLFNGLDPSLMSIFELRLKGFNYIKQCTPCFMVLVDISCPTLYLYFSNNVLVLSQGSIYKPKNAIIRCVASAVGQESRDGKFPGIPGFFAFPFPGNSGPGSREKEPMNKACFQVHLWAK